MGDRVAQFGGFEVQVGEREVLDCEGESFERDGSCCGGHCGSAGMRAILWNGTVEVRKVRVVFTIIDNFLIVVPGFRHPDDAGILTAKHTGVHV